LVSNNCDELTLFCSQYKTLRHCETVRNYLNACIIELLRRGEQHDQSKLQEPELSTYATVMGKLQRLTYGSPEHQANLQQLGSALLHHYESNRHHPEHFKHGIREMTLLDLIEMLVDWQSATIPHSDGNIHNSIAINQQRFGYGDELAQIFRNTAVWLLHQDVFHHAEES